MLNLHISKSILHISREKRLERWTKKVDKDVEDHSNFLLLRLSPNVTLAGDIGIFRCDKKAAKLAAIISHLI
jgi:hypothetical protein